MRATRRLRTNERQRYMLGMGQVLEREAGMILIAFMISSTFVLGEHYRLYGRVEKVNQEISLYQPGSECGQIKFAGTWVFQFILCL